MGYRHLEEDDAVKFILDVLRKAGRPMTTREIQAETERRLVRCPDSTVVFLSRLRTEGMIKGEMSSERRGWIWWIEN